MKRVLFDTKIILDVVLNRIPHYDASSKLFELIDLEIIEAFISGSSVTDIYYIARKEIGAEIVKRFLLELIDVVPVISVDQSIVLNALHSELKDFEDAVQVYSAGAYGIEFIITRNKKDFIGIELTVLTPNEALELFSKDINEVP
jgi:predicted nucleic acid-binding protein